MSSKPIYAATKTVKPRYFAVKSGVPDSKFIAIRDAFRRKRQGLPPLKKRPVKRAPTALPPWERAEKRRSTMAVQSQKWKEARLDELRNQKPRASAAAYESPLDRAAREQEEQEEQDKREMKALKHSFYAKTVRKTARKTVRKTATKKKKAAPRKASKGKMSAGQCYCLRCKVRIVPTGVRVSVSRNGVPLLQGTCPRCGGKVARFQKRA